MVVPQLGRAKVFTPNTKDRGLQPRNRYSRKDYGDQESNVSPL